MSNFAERLVARSAGTPPGPGISVLASRPMSRFEPVTGIEVEEPISPALAPPQADRRITQRQTERALSKTAARSRRSETSPPIQQASPRDTDPKPQVQAALLVPVPNEIGATPDHAISEVAVSDIPIVQDGTPQQITQSADLGEKNVFPPQQVSADATPPGLEDETQETQAAPPRVSGRKFEIESTQVGRPMRAAGRASPNGEEKPQQSPAPAISIGRIEVQFLPQEPRVPAPRPQPQRTRGFEAYARARRGEPR